MTRDALARFPHAPASCRSNRRCLVTTTTRYALSILFFSNNSFPKTGACADLRSRNAQGRGGSVAGRTATRAQPRDEEWLCPPCGAREAHRPRAHCRAERRSPESGTGAAPIRRAAVGEPEEQSSRCRRLGEGTGPALSLPASELPPAREWNTRTGHGNGARTTREASVVFVDLRCFEQKKCSYSLSPDIKDITLIQNRKFA